ncbi:RNA polymerase sigma-70 factor [Parabacteroides goldsteinii]|uniref:RNA polymerase sigma-70 factor n=1 Tax=Parabacteroides goldsteinii TaxID=328812 RepID=UPI00257065C1|nr:RNA polymerase sigma-70 factor [Parabacteroides goldsteinii]
MYNNSEQEKILIAGLIQDDESAFCELYALYKNRLMFFAMKFLKSKEFAEDVFQDAFTSVWQNRRFLNPDSPFAPYVYTIVKNRILSLLAGIEKEQQLKNVILSGSVDVTNDTEDKILDDDLNQLLEKALLDLTSQQRRIFDMSRKEMKSHKEIAEELNISVYTVQQHISASLKVIRSYLVKYSGTYADLLVLLFCLNS